MKAGNQTELDQADNSQRESLQSSVLTLFLILFFGQITCVLNSLFFLLQHNFFVFQLKHWALKFFRCKKKKSTSSSDFLPVVWQQQDFGPASNEIIATTKLQQPFTLTSPQIIKQTGHWGVFKGLDYRH